MVFISRAKTQIWLEFGQNLALLITDMLCLLVVLFHIYYVFLQCYYLSNCHCILIRMKIRQNLLMNFFSSQLAHFVSVKNIRRELVYRQDEYILHVINRVTLIYRGGDGEWWLLNGNWESRSKVVGKGGFSDESDTKSIEQLCKARWHFAQPFWQEQWSNLTG